MADEPEGSILGEEHEPEAPGEPSRAIVPSSRAILARSALLTGLCRFVPIPFLDDYLEAKVRHFMTYSLLRRAGRTYRAGHLAPLWEGADGCLGGCVGFVLTLPWTLLVKLAKKLWRSVLFVFAIREAALHVAETFLLGRTVARLLDRGELPEGKEHEPDLALRKEAAEVRRAFEVAWKGSDVRLLRRVFEPVFRAVTGLPRVGAQAVRSMFGRRTEAEAPADAPEASRDALEQGEAQLGAALDTQEVATFVEDFDTRFDRALDELRATLPPARAR